ncbi:MAG: hypothetical protein ACE141_09215 [Bryobacteraceae bacterium]
MKIARVLVPLVVAAVLAAAADYPQTEISNGEIRARVYLPDPKKGFYTSTRFDWSGAVDSLVYRGHEYFARWFHKADPKVKDIAYEGDLIVSEPYTAMVGPAEEFETGGLALGYLEAKPGGTFIKTGVGVLRKVDDSRYHHSKPYEIVDGGKWSVNKRRDAVDFRHVLRDPSSGYAYDYRKTVSLTPGKPEMVIAHVLKNTGTLPIDTTVYNHNFFYIDSQPPGPDFSITFPFQLKARRAPNKELGEIRGNQLVYLKTLEGQERLHVFLEGFGETAKDYDIRIENRKVKAGVRITSDHPLSALSVWSIRTALSPEPFQAMKIEPGKQVSWKLTYEFYTLD